MEKTLSSASLSVSQRHIHYKQWLATSIKAWIIVVLAGQWMFALYILAQFAMPWMSGTLDESQFSHMIEGYVNGDDFNNKVLLLHIIPVLVISLSATFQLVPYVRTHYPTFHRLNGRLFLTIGVLGALTGIYLTWGRGTRLSDIGALGTTLNGLLIPVFCILAWRFAVRKQFTLHRRFAVHAFILINGVWSLRLYLMGWFMVNQGSFGNNATMDGPADLIISYACYLFPMAVAEFVFWAETKAKPKTTLVASGLVAFAVVITAIGVVSATIMMWWPRISGAFYS